MYKKDLKIGKKNIQILCTHTPYFVNENTIIFGFPFNIEKRPIVKEDLNKIKGYFLQIGIKDNEIEIINDISGLYRFYYLEKDDTIYFSNDFLTLFNILPKENRTLNKFELEYWDKHRYTTGGGTVCNEIKKIKPAHIYTFKENNIEEQLYFKDVKNKPNRKRHFEEVLADMRDTVSIIKKMPQKKFLLFSGGADSTLVAKMLQEQNVDFIPVFGKHVPTNSMNYDDILKIKYSSELLGIKPVELEIDISEKMSQDIVDKMFLDRNITQAFYKIPEKIKEKYGQDVILITGQSSDSIFALGPTDISFKQNIVRLYLFKPLSLLSKFLFPFSKLFFKKFKNFRLPVNQHEYEMAFFDEKYYFPGIDHTKSDEYFAHINNIVSYFFKKISDKVSRRMYLKIYGFMQGSDNYVNVQNVEYFGMKSIFLFATPQIIYSTAENTDYNYEICHTKSVVFKILKDIFNYTMPDIKKEKNYKKNCKATEQYSDYVKFVDKNFYNKMESLEFAD